MPDDSDLTEVISFLRLVRDLLSRIALEGHVRQGTPIIPIDLRPQLREAWKELEEQRTFEYLETTIQQAGLAALTKVGLSGAQLRLKLGLVDRVKRRFERYFDKPHLGPFLEIIDKILDSLLPFGSEKVKEFKGIVEWIANRGDEFLEPERT